MGLMKKITDGWGNILTGMGFRSTDKSRSTQFVGGFLFDEVTLSDIYRDEGFGRRIIDLPTDEMTRQWIEIGGDTDGEMLNELKAIDAQAKIRDLVRWSKLFGGAIAVMGLEDGGELDKPLNENSIKFIDFIHVYDRYRLSWTSTDLYTDPTNKKFGEVEFYTVDSLVDGVQFRVHETRVLKMDGKPIPDRAKLENEGWGDSCLQSPYDRLVALGTAYNNIGSIIDDFVQVILTIDGLGTMLSSKDGEQEVIDRLQLMDLTRSTFNTTVLDNEEQYTKHSSTVTGLQDLLDRFVLALSAVTGIPVTLLMGQSPAGLKATGDNDIRNWYDKVKSEQRELLGPVLERLITLIMLSKESAFKGKILEDWTLIFNPLWQPSDEEIAKTRKLVAETDNLYLNTGVLDPKEVTDSRFGGDTYSMETSVDPIRAK